MYSWQVGKRWEPRPGSAVARLSLLWYRGLRRGLLWRRGRVFPSETCAKGGVCGAAELAQWVPPPLLEEGASVPPRVETLHVTPGEPSRPGQGCRCVCANKGSAEGSSRSILPLRTTGVAG